MEAISAADSAFMARAIRLAKRGLYTAHPNPMVGCVIVRDGEIVGEGWHKATGLPHAEINALAAASDSATTARRSVPQVRQAPAVGPFLKRQRGQIFPLTAPLCTES